MRKSGGFSLVEMMIVIAVLGIVLAIAAPNFTVYRDNTNLREAARDISSDIQLCRQRAVAENVSYRITFAANTYTMQRQTAPGSAAWEDVATKTIGGGNALISLIAVPSFFPGGTATLTFQTRGTSGNGTIRLRHANRPLIAEITTTVTGRVHVQYL